MKVCIDYNSNSLQKLYKDLKLPEFAYFTRLTEHPPVLNLEKELKNELERFSACIKPGMSVAVAVGSRGIDQIDMVVKVIIHYLKEKSAKPYIVAAMGSHGGATCEGQKRVLAEYGITEEKMGVKILTSMEVEDISSKDDNIPAFIACDALIADKVLLVNRIKSHTDFSGNHESGLMKLIAIGLGKHKGALACHSFGWDEMSNSIQKIASRFLDSGKVMGGIGIVENEMHQVCKIEAIPAEWIPLREAELLSYSRETIGKIPFSKLDALIVCKSGKDISGSGIDPNVTGRKLQKDNARCQIDYVVCSDLTDKTEGNAIGVGNADIICKRIVDKIDLSATYMNGITSRGLSGTKIPLIVENDVEAIKLCMFLCNKTAGDIKVACIRDTSSVNSFYISSALIEEANSFSCLTFHAEEKLPVEKGYIQI
jgi:hypothetical protein